MRVVLSVGAMYKRTEDGIVLVDQDRCRGGGCAYRDAPQEGVFHHKTGKAEKCTFCYPRVEVGLPTVRGDLRGTVALYRAPPL